MLHIALFGSTVRPATPSAFALNYSDLSAAGCRQDDSGAPACDCSQSAEFTSASLMTRGKKARMEVWTHRSVALILLDRLGKAPWLHSAAGDPQRRSSCGGRRLKGSLGGWPEQLELPTVAVWRWPRSCQEFSYGLFEMRAKIDTRPGGLRGLRAGG
eukprot:Skav229345  [mRNA]  locus=scaffold2596:350522:352498:- [translate_table: standard]